jgi:hypothetical protein
VIASQLGHVIEKIYKRKQASMLINTDEWSLVHEKEKL